jgi:hypothetical protein
VGGNWVPAGQDCETFTVDCGDRKNHAGYFDVNWQGPGEYAIYVDLIDGDCDNGGEVIEHEERVFLFQAPPIP